MQVLCNKCGSIDDYNVQVKSNNHVAYCNGCGAYIKNIPYDEPKMYFGKYKGRAISKIDDLSYLEWASNNLRLTEKIMTAIKSQIISLKTLML